MKPPVLPRNLARKTPGNGTGWNTPGRRTPPNKHISLQSTFLGRCNPQGSAGCRTRGHSLPRCTCALRRQALCTRCCSCTCHPCRGRCQNSPQGSDGALQRVQDADRLHQQSHSHRYTPQGCVLKSTSMSRAQCSLLDILGLCNSRLSSPEDTSKFLPHILHGRMAMGKLDVGSHPQGCFLA